MRPFDLSNYDAAVFDLDGTVWLSGDPIPGAAEFLTECRGRGLTVAFATNITLSSVDDVRRELLDTGLALDGESVITAGLAVVETVLGDGITEVVALSSPPLVAALRAAGITVVHIDDANRELWAAPRPGAALVLTGWPDATLRQIEAIGQLAAHGHPIYISSLDAGFPGRNAFEPGAGMMVAAARALHRFEPIVCGKPSVGYAAAVKRALGESQRIVMFGDSQRADVGLGHLMGADSVLLVGDPAKPVADDLPSPHYVATRLGALVKPVFTAPVNHTVTATKGIIYAQIDGFRPLELDLYVPDASPWPVPLLVYVHGGGWRVSTRQTGPRETRGWDSSVFDRWCAAGFAVAAVEYRYSGEALHPAPIDDVAVALDWLRDNGTSYGIDARRMVLWGQSAGGHLAASLALRPNTGPISGVICWYPLTDFPALGAHDAWRFAEQYLGHPIIEDLVHARAASSTTLPHRNAPPFLLQHGTDDIMAPFDQSVRLHAALAAEGVAVTLEPVPGADHFFVGHADVEGIFQRAVDFARSVI